MVRASLGNPECWNKWTVLRLERIEEQWQQIRHTPSQNPIYEPQYVFNLSQNYLRYLLTLYSRGDPVKQLPQYFEGILDAWALSNSLSAEICISQKIETCRDWIFRLSDLNHYNWCFWLTGLALALEVPSNQWQRLLELIGGEGEDILLDRVIASRQSDRKLGTKLLHQKPYARLLKAIDAPKENQAILLKEFADHWYAELARKGKEELWWYVYGDPIKHPLEMGSYFGRWCIEAVAAVKAFNLDDSLCLGHEHYPGDLLRPNGPSTHKARVEQGGSWLAKLFRTSNGGADPG